MLHHNKSAARQTDPRGRPHSQLGLLMVGPFIQAALWDMGTVPNAPNRWASHKRPPAPQQAGVLHGPLHLKTGAEIDTVTRAHFVP